MPSKKKVDKSSDGEFDDDYRKKRDRNNQAVKRSRAKTKQKTKETQHRVTELKVKNQILEDRIKNLTKDLQFLKELFMGLAKPKSEKEIEMELEKILADDDEDDEIAMKSE